MATSKPLGRDGDSSAWVVPISCLAWSAAWLTTVLAGIELGIKMNGVNEDRLGGAGPDVFDIASSEISTAILILSALLWAVGGLIAPGVLSRFGMRLPCSLGELVGTTLIWLGVGLVLVPAMFFFGVFGILNRVL